MRYTKIFGVVGCFNNITEVNVLRKINNKARRENMKKNLVQQSDEENEQKDFIFTRVDPCFRETTAQANTKRSSRWLCQRSLRFSIFDE